MSKKLIFWYGIKMKNKNTILIGILLIGIVLISGCIKEIEKIPSKLCIEEGGRGYFGKDECCSGLTSLLRWTICDTPGDKRGCDENGCFPPPPDGSFICTKCGDKICGLGENRCNCPKDCSEEFCGWSTYAKCKTDADCNMGGCSGEVCEGKGEGTITDCMWRDCYNVTGYECKCIDDKCQWSK